jgi:hypothetical protein
VPSFARECEEARSRVRRDLLALEDIAVVGAALVVRLEQERLPQMNALTVLAAIIVFSASQEHSID